MNTLTLMLDFVKDIVNPKHTAHRKELAEGYAASVDSMLLLKLNQCMDAVVNAPTKQDAIDNIAGLYGLAKAGVQK